MIGWSGRRKTLTILAFIVPTLLGVVVFSVFPFIFNGFISLTNRGRFHPNPDCTQTLWKIVEPSCWLAKPPRGMAEPFGLQEPLFKNYADLMGGLFKRETLTALVLILIALLPLFVALALNRRLDRKLARPVSSSAVWSGGLLGVVILGWLVDLPQAVSTLMDSGSFITVNIRTIMYVVACIPLFFALGLLMALLLNDPNLRGRTFFRVVLIVPWAASNVAIMMSLVWQFFFRQQGTINQLLSAIFENFKGPTYLNESAWAFAVVVLVNLWYTYPFFMVVILGGLQSIPSSLYEAAEVDGATWWHKLQNITLPLLRPTVLPIIVLSSLTTYKVDAVVWGVTKGGPVAGAGKPGGTEFVMVHAYKQIFQTGAFGRMGAFAVILFIMLFVATLYSLRLTQITRGVYE